MFDLPHYLVDTFSSLKTKYQSEDITNARQERE